LCRFASMDIQQLFFQERSLRNSGRDAWPCGYHSTFLKPGPDNLCGKSYLPCFCSKSCSWQLGNFFCIHCIAVIAKNGRRKQSAKSAIQKHPPQYSKSYNFITFSSAVVFKKRRRRFILLHIGPWSGHWRVTVRFPCSLRNIQRFHLYSSSRWSRSDVK